MKKIIDSLLLIAFLAAGIFTLASCSDDDDEGTSRLFRPVLSSDKIKSALDANNIPYIEVKWDAFADANLYRLTLEPTDGSEPIVVETDSSAYVFENLPYDTEFNLKIKALNTSRGVESKDFATSVTTRDFPTQLQKFTTTNIIDTQVRVVWNTQDGETLYDELRILDPITLEIIESVPVTEEDLLAGEKIIRNLQPSTQYRVEAYLGGAYQGKQTFKTTSSENYEGTVVDLRGLTAEESYKWFSMSSTSAYANALDSLVQSYPDQDITIVLQGGVKYRVPTVDVPSTNGKITIVTGLSLAGEAELGVEGNFGVASGATVQEMAFNKVFFTDTDNKPRTSSNYGGAYLFNFNRSGAKLNNLKITNSQIKYKRGVCRIQTSATIDNVEIDNCVLDSIGGYGIVNLDNAGAVVNHISMTNSTASNCSKTFVGTKMSTLISSLNIENCTFVYCIPDNKSFFDFKAKPIADFNVKNCLFGRAGETWKVDVTTGITGWSGDVKPNLSNCMFTNDIIWVLDAVTSVPKAQLDGTTLKYSTKEIFADPDKSNFKIKDITELTDAKCGDPRWY